MRRPVRRVLAPLAFALFSSFLGTTAQSQILIGQSVGITGTVAATVAEADQGAQMLFDHVNAQGGIHGQKIELIRMDDQFDVKRTLDNAKTLIEQRNVLALFMTRGTPNTQELIPLLDQQGVALIGPSTGAIALSKPVQRHVYNVRATYQRETEKAVNLLTTVGVRDIAVVYANDSFGKDALIGAQRGLSAANLTAVAEVPADRISPDYASIIPKVAKAHAVIWVGSGTPVANGIKALRAAGSGAQVVTLSNNASAGFVKELGDKSKGVIVTQVFPSERALAHPFVGEAAALAKGKLELSPAVLEGFASAKVMVEALRRAGPKPSRSQLVNALNTMQSYDLGGGLTINYTAQDHSGISYADSSIISGGRFMR